MKIVSLTAKFYWKPILLWVKLIDGLLSGKPPPPPEEEMDYIMIISCEIGALAPGFKGASLLFFDYLRVDSSLLYDSTSSLNTVRFYYLGLTPPLDKALLGSF